MPPNDSDPNTPPTVAQVRQHIEAHPDAAVLMLAGAGSAKGSSCFVETDPAAWLDVLDSESNREIAAVIDADDRLVIGECYNAVLDRCHGCEPARLDDHERAAVRRLATSGHLFDLIATITDVAREEADSLRKWTEGFGDENEVEVKARSRVWQRVANHLGEAERIARDFHL